MTADHPFDAWGAENEILLFEAIADAKYKPLPSANNNNNNSTDAATTTTSISDEFRDWIDQLLVKDPTQRLGYDNERGRSKEKSQLLTHPWLAQMRMTQLRRRAVKAPWKPKIMNHHDSSFFDDWDHLDPVMKTNFPPLNSREMAMFEKFDQV